MDPSLPQTDPRYRIVGSNLALTAKQRTLIGLAEELGRETSR